MEGRIIGFLLRIFALGVTGYITALIAAHLRGFNENVSLSTGDRTEIAALRAEIAELRETLRERRRKDNLIVERRPAGPIARPRMTC